MILFIGQVGSDQRDREAFQEVDYRQMFGPAPRFAKWVGESHDADRLPEIRRAAPSTSRLQGRPGPGGAGAARGHARRRRPRRRARRVEPALAAPAPAALASAARAARARRAAVRHRRRQRLDAAIACGRSSASPSAGSCRWAARSASRTFDNRHPNYAGDVGIGINPEARARASAMPTWCSRSARASAR